MNKEDKIRQVIQTGFDNCLIQWTNKALTENGFDRFASIVSDEEDLFPFFILEFQYDAKASLKHFNFIAKFKANDTDKAIIQLITTILMEHIDLNRQMLLETIQQIRPIKSIRFIVEKKIPQRFAPAKDCKNYFYLYTIGEPLADCIQKRKDWLVNTFKGVAVYGMVLTDVEFEVFGPNNLSTIPTSKARHKFDIMTTITVGEFKEIIRQTRGVIRENYTIGSFFSKEGHSENVLDKDESQVFSIITEPPKYQACDIACLVVYDEELLM